MVYLYIYTKIKTKQKKRSALERNVECLSFHLDAGVLKFAAAKLYPLVQVPVCKVSAHTWDFLGTLQALLQWKSFSNRRHYAD